MGLTEMWKAATSPGSHVDVAVKKKVVLAVVDEWLLEKQDVLGFGDLWLRVHHDFSMYYLQNQQLMV